jgi:hypothetical protein
LATLPSAATTITTTTAAVDTTSTSSTSTSSTSTSGTSSTSSSGGRSGKAPEGARNGYVFGTGEWSASNVSLDDAKLSIDNVVAAGEKKKRPHASSSFHFGKVHLEKSTWKSPLGKDVQTHLLVPSASCHMCPQPVWATGASYMVTVCLAGANALEFMVTYYAKDGTESTTFYPVRRNKRILAFVFTVVGTLP